jgi:hypothetical protein
MLRKITLILALAMPFIGSAQIKVIENSTSTTDVDGQTFTVSGNLSSLEFVKYLQVINETTDSLNLKVRRTEIDVQSGTKNATCWKVCPPAVYAGTEPIQYSYSDWVAPGDTNLSFSAHHYLEGLDGCSLYKYEWLDAATLTILYKTVFIKFDNSSTGCAADLSVDGSNNIKTTLYPNPSSGNTFIEVEGLSGEVSYEVTNLLGQRSLTGYSNVQVSGKLNFNVAGLNNGVYFVTIKNNGKTVRTEKLIVKN